MLHQNLKMAIRFKRRDNETPKYLNKISCGKEILNIVEGVNAYSFNNDEPNSKDEAKLIEDFFRIINDSRHFRSVEFLVLSFELKKDKMNPMKKWEGIKGARLIVSILKFFSIYPVLFLYE